MTAHSVHNPHADQDFTPSAFSIGGVVLVVALVGTGLAYSIDWMSRNAAPAQTVDANVYAITISGEDLTVPGEWIRFADQRRNGFSERLDLRFPVDFSSGNAEQVTIEVSLQPGVRLRSSDELIDQVYLHQFGSGESEGVHGLVGKPLRPQEGYADETVWYDPLSAHPFVAKCLAPVRPEATSRCLRTIQVTPRVAAAYVFDAELLENWREFDETLKPFFRRLGLVR